jgi:hypothetical protein
MRPRYPRKFLVELEETQYADLKAAARAEGSAMADIIREAIAAYLRTLGPVTTPTPQEAD